MSREKLYHGITYIDDALVEDAAKPTRQAHHTKRFAAMAACACLVVLGALLWKQSTPTRPTAPDIPHVPAAPAQVQKPEQGITLPLPQIEKPAGNVAADMIAFFIYQNRWYEWYSELPDESLVGEYVGTSNGSIDEWTTPDGYVDFAGSVYGDFYTVNGYTTDTALCLRDGGFCPAGLYLCSHGITLYQGSDLYTDRLPLSTYVSAAYETRRSWYYDDGAMQEYTGDPAVLQSFLDALNEGRFLYTEDIPLPENGNNVYDDLEVYHLYFTLSDGITVHLRLFSGGYVMLQNMREVCVQVPQEAFDALLTQL